MTDMSPEARRLLGLARRGDDLREADRARLTQRVAQRLTLAVGAAGMTLVSAKAASGAGFALLLGKGAAVGVLVTATTFGVWKAAEQASSSRSAAEVRSAVPLSERASSRAAVAEPASSGVAVTEPASDPAAPDGELIPAPIGSASSTARTAPLNDGQIAGAKAVAAARTAPLNDGQIADQAGAKAVAASSKPNASSRPGATDPLQDEVAAFRTVQHSMAAGEARRALSLVAEQNRRFSAGALQQERAAARVFALCALGRIAEARNESQAFEQRWPRSPMLARVRRACDAELAK